MTVGLSQYFQRAPRYILIPQDDCLIRVAGPKQTPWEESTEIRNISQSGLCFTAPNVLLPQMGEYVKVQFEVPGSQQMACHGRVVRIEKMGEEFSLVGLEFESLTSAQRWNLTRGLKKKKTTGDGDREVIEISPGSEGAGNLNRAQIVSAGLSLFFAALLLFGIYRILAEPLWLDQLYLILESLWQSWFASQQ